MIMIIIIGKNIVALKRLDNKICNYRLVHVTLWLMAQICKLFCTVCTLLYLSEPCKNKVFKRRCFTLFIQEEAKQQLLWWESFLGEFFLSSCLLVCTLQKTSVCTTRSTAGIHSKCSPIVDTLMDRTFMPVRNKVQGLSWACWSYNQLSPIYDECQTQSAKVFGNVMRMGFVKNNQTQTLLWLETHIQVVLTSPLSHGRAKTITDLVWTCKLTIIK